MAPTVTLCLSSSMGMQSCDAMMGYAKRRPASGIWLSQPSTLLLPMSTTVSSSSGKKGSSHSEAAIAAALDVNLSKQEEAALASPAFASPALALPALAAPVCETPKSKKHRLPVVDVDLCPPAPKKGCRDHCRLPVACSGEHGRSNFHQKLSFSLAISFKLHIFQMSSTSRRLADTWLQRPCAVRNQQATSDLLGYLARFKFIVVTLLHFLALFLKKACLRLINRPSFFRGFCAAVVFAMGMC